MEYVDNTSGVIVKTAKPNFRKLGQIYGPKMKDIAKAVSQLDQEQINRFEKEKKLDLHIGDEIITLGDDDLLIQSQDIPGWTVANEGGITVALDIHITEDLLKEGLARDLVNRIQNLRKEMGLDVQDKINVIYQSDDDIVTEAISANNDYICREVQAMKLEPVDQISDGKELDLDKYKIKVKVAVAG
jgi:isoleucyl-tRNA synthetase